MSVNSAAAIVSTASLSLLPGKKYLPATLQTTPGITSKSAMILKIPSKSYLLYADAEFDRQLFKLSLSCFSPSRNIIATGKYRPPSLFDTSTMISHQPEENSK